VIAKLKEKVLTIDSTDRYVRTDRKKSESRGSQDAIAGGLLTSGLHPLRMLRCRPGEFLLEGSQCGRRADAPGSTRQGRARPEAAG